MESQTCPGTHYHPLNWLWVGAAVLVGIGAFLYWALGFYLVEALLGTSKVQVEWGRDSRVTKFVQKHCKSLVRGRYRSPPLLCSPHLQTVYLVIDPFQPSIKYRREVVIQRDGGSVGLDWAGPDEPKTPTIVIVPGLTSDSDTGYIKYAVAALTKKGWRSVVINHRGLGGVSLTSDATHNAGWTTDIREVISVVKSRFPNAPLGLLGASLGANMVIKYLGEEGDKTPVKGAVTIGSPYDMLIVDRFMNRSPIQKVWNFLMTGGLKEYAEKNREPFGRVVDRAYLMASKTVHEFDDRITRVIGKYETVDTYYRKSSCAPYVTSVRAPLLAMSALDDPICTRETIPWDECRLNPNVVLATAARGGHLAVYEGWLPTRLWWTKPCEEFLGAIFKEGI